MSKKQSIPSDDLSFEPDELAEVGAVLAPASQASDRDESASSKTPPQAMGSFDDQVDAAFSEEETAEKQPSIADDADLQGHFGDYSDASATLETIQPVSTPVVTVQPSRRSAEGMKSSAGEIEDATPPAVHAESAQLPSVIFEDSPFGDESKAAAEDSHPITPHVAAVAAAMDGRGQPVADAVLSSSQAA